MKLDRRTFLSAGGSLLAASLGAPRASAALRLFGGGDEREGRTLVLIQLAGGNDGLSTVVPYAHPVYQSTRTSIRHKQDELLVIDDERALNGKLVGLKSLYDAGKLAIVEGAGYPNGIRSHFKSFDVWHTASTEGRAVGEGWVPRLVRDAFPREDAPERTVHIGKRVPYSLHSPDSAPIAFEVPESYRWFGEAPGEVASGESTGNPALDKLRGVQADASASSQRIRSAARKYKTSVQYPNSEFGRALRVAAALIDARIGGRVISIEVGGFDTHKTQRGTHDNLMKTLDDGLASFTADLRGRTAGDETLVVVFSEFGRRVAENGSRGTDHGRAGPMFVLGTPVAGGLYGEAPNLDRLESGDLAFTTDFRRVYATVCERWFGANTKAVLGADYEALKFV
ncbi:MAG: DUF1501 domain-containing protein [Planctomycetes bacterium]|nr:DUF1501 domain-containing protein [Planctomycetota bacterium]MCB9904953.1 DUF1501 domain-containing protein [Planctomycetota bacterium]